jgi:hypothetical protein
VEVDAHIGTHVELASWLRLSVFTLNTVVKNHEEIDERYIQCGLFSKQQKSLNCLPMENFAQLKAST